MQRRHQKIGFLLIVFVSVGFVFGGTVSKEFRKQYPFEMNGTVGVHNVNGAVYVESWDEQSVEIYAEIEVKAGNRKEAEDFLEHVTIQVDQQKDRLFVEPDYPRSRGGSFWDWLFGRKPQVSITFRVRVPYQTNTEIKSVNGRVEVSDISGHSELRTTNGGITADNMRGAVDGHTVNGTIRVMLTKASDNDRMSFRTTNGGIQLTLPEDIQADIDASTVNGGVSTDFPLEIRGKFNSKKISGRINGGGVSIDLHTVNGGIRINEE
jgi:hypothetical protein